MKKHLILLACVAVFGTATLSAQCSGCGGDKPKPGDKKEEPKPQDPKKP